MDSVVLILTEGLAKYGDGLHYNTAGQIELGRRFAEGYFQITEVP